MSIFTKVFGSKNERDVKALRPILDKVNSLDAKAVALSDADFPVETQKMKQNIAGGATLDSQLPWAFAICREAARRVLGERPYDEQVMGAIVLHQGKILELKTGEGKTLTSTMAAYLNALEGKGVHVVTVNDYLAQRDSEWMGKVYRFLGLSVGVVLSSMAQEAKVPAYNADITYGTNNEFGFDYLRDNMKYSQAAKLQQRHHYCIIDEIDSILIDEARTPLIISGQGEDDSQKARNAERISHYFRECEKDPQTGEYPDLTLFDRFDRENAPKEIGDYKIDEKSKHISLTAQGMEKTESLLLKNNMIKGSLYDDENFDYVHYVTQALTARLCYRRDVDYIVADNKIQIVDEFTGRILEGRRYGEGLHQAIEAKEHIKVYGINKTIATITLQNFFRMYEKLSGMTGTADTEAPEFLEIYNLDVVVIPTHLPVAREDLRDKVYLNDEYKLKAIVNDIVETHGKGQPILVGTVSIEKSELLSRMLTRAGIKHEVLNAKNHEREAHIIENAGMKGAVTIATNMAGRGTDIKLGGSLESMARKKVGSEADEQTLKAAMEELRPKWIESCNEVKALGGLYVLGTERHESRRIDNQLRGRSGRQGDPGKSCFYVSFDDNLMRLFAKDGVKSMIGRLGLGDEAIENGMVTKIIESAQKKVEEYNFDIRKHLLEYDNVLNEQRDFIYSQRDQILNDPDISGRLLNTLETEVGGIFDDCAKMDGKERVEFVYEALKEDLKLLYPFKAEDESKTNGQLKEEVLAEFKTNLLKKKELIGEDVFSGFTRQVYLMEIDKRWQDHLDQLTQLMDAVRLRSYAQKNPLTEYKLEGFQIFEDMLASIRKAVVSRMLMVKIALRNEPKPESRAMNTSHEGMNSFAARPDAPRAQTIARPAQENRVVTVVRSQPKVGRNDPCPCGSGLKYKNCCGKNA